MSTYEIQVAVKFDETMTFTIDAANETDARDQATELTAEILSETSFLTYDNIKIENLVEIPAAYTRLNSPEQANQGYTSLADLYRNNTQPSTLQSSYNRLT